MRLVIIGHRSFIASYVAAAARAQGQEVLALPHNADLGSLLWREDRVVNFAVAPALRHLHYRVQDDFDLHVARIAARTGASFTMLSTRRVYASEFSWNAVETSPATGNETVFGQNKASSEKAVIAATDGRASIFRLSNIFGYEYAAVGRETFFVQLLNRLKKDGQVVFNMSPGTRRDFLPVEICGDAIARHAGIGGIYNLGCGFPVPCADVASWVLKGYEGGALISQSSEVRDEFFLNTEKWRGRFGLPVDLTQLSDYCAQIGQRLRCEK